MQLGVGATVGPYEVLSIAGSGGMGEVYKARDRRLGRTVALKILHQAHTDRFEREARAISAVNHPGVCALFDIGTDNGLSYLVMEWVEGHPLRGPLAIAEALRLGIEICEALATAHRQGIIHRDLKPSNIVVGKSGIKLLDFGLAKMSNSQAGPPATPTAATETLTREHMIVGTLPYMAPELLNGKAADCRTDIFAFGAVFYEMLTGKPPFEGSTQASLIAAIMNTEPVRVSAVQPLVPAGIEHIVNTCLAKDPNERWQNADDLKYVLSIVGAAAEPAVHLPRQRPWIVFALACILASALTVTYFGVRPRNEATYRLSINAPRGTEFLFGDTMGGSAISPDGRMVAFIAQASTSPMLWVRSLDSESARALAGTEDAYYPFWSPDSRSLGFFADRKLKRVSVSGAPAQVLCSVDRARGGAWNEHGDILFVPGPGPSGRIHRISEDGGVVTTVTHFDSSQQEEGHYWPQFLPGGRTFLYFVRHSDPEKFGIYAGSLDDPSKKRWIAMTTSAGVYVPGAAWHSGHLLWCRGQALLADTFDPKSFRLAGSPSVVADGVGTFGVIGLANFSASKTGALAYSSQGVDRMQIMWMSREGRQLDTLAGPGTYFDPAVSGDGTRLAFVRTDGLALHIWTADLGTRVTSRTSFGGITEMLPVWSPNGNEIAFMATRRGKRVLMLHRVGSVSDVQLTDSGNPQYPTSWSPDGRFLLYYEVDRITGSDLWALQVDKHDSALPLLRSAANEMGAQVSPDGKWVAYYSDESGRWEIYVQRFAFDKEAASLGAKWQVSSNGGRLPRWRRDGRELFYVSSDGTLTSVAVAPDETTFHFSLARPLFRLPAKYVVWRYTYDVGPDGSRFVVVGDAASNDPQPLTLLLNWQNSARNR
jgi:serine/threonine protein kinase